MALRNYDTIGTLKVHKVLRAVVENEIAPGTGVDSKKFFSSLEKLINKFFSRNEALLRKRDAIQAQIDAYHLDRVGTKIDHANYATFLTNIGYIVPEGPVSSLYRIYLDFRCLLLTLRILVLESY